MAIINRFSDSQDELNYLRTERTKRLNNLRVGYIILFVAAVGNIILTPSFSNEQARIAFSISAVALLAIAAVSYYFSGTRYYLEQRRFDIFFIVREGLTGPTTTLIK